MKPIIIVIIVFIIIVLAVSFYLVVNRAKNTTIIDSSLVTAVGLTVNPQGSGPYDAVGQIIQYRLDISNAGNTSIPGIVSVTGAAVNCPSITTIGNHDNYLDANETLTCSASHLVTQADLDAGFVTLVTTANVNGTLSPSATTTVPMVQNRQLTLTKSADPSSFDHVGQVITYTYVITNTGNVTISPAQFTGSDTGFNTPLTCGDPGASLAPNKSVTCTAAYTVTQADLDAGSITTSVTISDSVNDTSSPVTVTVTRAESIPATGQAPAPSSPTPSNLTPGTTIQHEVVDGEWLWQISRCYGASLKQVINANPQVSDPDEIFPNTTITVPNIGSVSPIYGPPCITTYVVQSGDSWESIAQKFNADLAVLHRVNPVALVAGTTLKMPLNSAEGK